MIRNHGTSANRAAEWFREWSACFTEEIFVILTVYADESDIYRDGPTPTLCGFIQTKDYWVQFSKKWQRVLDEFGAPYFHFREFADKKNASVIEKSPYRTWSDKKKERFLYDLALLCADGAIPVGASYSARHHRKFAAEGNPYEVTINLFFHDLILRLNQWWPNYKDRVLIIFDRTENEEWLAPLNTIHKE